ncbi:hypothetical protein BST81_25040 [Leptolyngbya sp. 'hensonii']|uniref:GumC family protein n=1 Tax=Leptolyngbya sp. 'hensonii' TaxID=1922337 RepID=UPI00094F969B|nr:polysaccharide biosynthesis tyrosine autokinase [Leptolyngbya sp. 'hensonii']OLP15697.1 hypothetical protein BST81_25040 [Leptolyngbya sp. 'hensonii']
MQIQPYNFPPPPTPAQPQPLPLTYYAAGYEQDEFNLKQFLGIVRRRIWIIAGVALAVTGSIWSWTLTRTPVYQAGFQVLVEPVTNLSKSPEVLLFGTQSSFDYATQIEVLRSPQILADVVKRVQKTYPQMSYGELAGKLLIRQVQDEEGRSTKILIVEYRDKDPQTIKLVLDKLAEVYLQYSIELRQTSLQQGVQFVEAQLPDLRKRVNQLQTDLERFRQRYSLVDPESRGADLAGQLSNIERQKQDTQAELAQTQSLYAALRQQVGYQPQEAIVAASLSESGRYQNLLNQLQEVELKIATESTRFQADSPNMQVLLEKRKSLLPLLNLESQRVLGAGRSTTANPNLTETSIDLSRQMIAASNKLKTLEVRMQALTTTDQQLKQQFALVPSLARQYTDLQRELKVATESLNRFLSTRENLQLEAAQRALPWQLLTTPYVPILPISPNIPRNLTVGVIAGLLLGMGAALLAEKLDNVFHSANDLKDTTRLPLLGIIPHSRDLRLTSPMMGLEQADRTAGSLEPATESLTLEDPDVAGLTRRSRSGYYNASPFMDSFRSLYTNIRFLSSDEPIRSLVVGSAVPADGKSTVAVHLAQAAAAMGQRVLLVDADLRRPQVHSIMNVVNMRGLSNLIAGDLDPEDVIQPSPMENNLFILTAGQIPPDPTKLLSSKRMQNLAEQFRSQFDLVVYDTPPLLGLADSSLLATHTDGIVLVVGLGRTDRSVLMQALDGLKVSAASVLGIVANGVENYTTGDYYQSYYRRYYAQAKPAMSEETPVSG